VGQGNKKIKQESGVTIVYICGKCIERRKLKVDRCIITANGICESCGGHPDPFLAWTDQLGKRSERKPKEMRQLPMNKRQVDVGDLRQQSALSDSDRPVIIVSDDKKLPPLEIVEVYPDTVDETGLDIPTFKIKVKRKENEE
jgi:hypothetical protein